MSNKCGNKANVFGGLEWVEMEDGDDYESWMLVVSM